MLSKTVLTDVLLPWSKSKVKQEVETSKLMMSMLKLERKGRPWVKQHYVSYKRDKSVMIIIEE